VGQTRGINGKSQLLTPRIYGLWYSKVFSEAVHSLQKSESSCFYRNCRSFRHFFAYTYVSLSIVRVLCIYRYGTPSVHFRLLQTPKLNDVYTLGTIEIRTSRANVIKNHRAAATVTYGRDRRHDGRGIMTITFKARARVYFVNNRRSLNKPNENIKLR